MSTLEDILSDKDPEPIPQEVAPEPEPEPVETGEPKAEQPRDETGKFATKPKAEEAPKPEAKMEPPSIEENPATVPFEALKDERRKRQELEAQLREFRQAQPKQKPAPDLFQDPEGWQQHFGNQFQQAMLNERANMSEIMARQAHQDFDKVWSIFEQMAQQNPVLAQQALQQPHPYDWAYQQAKRFQALQEIGDPTSYRERLEVELREKLLAEMQQNQPQPQSRPQLPQSLATARNAGSRSGPAWSGPTPLTDIIK